MAEQDGARIARLELALLEATETIEAIRSGEVDAIVIGGGAGEEQVVYTLENADRPYRVLVEQMKEGAVTLDQDGLILYANRSFGELVGRDVATLLGTSMLAHIADPTRLQSVLREGGAETEEVCVRSAGGSEIPANMSVVELRVMPGSPRMFCSIVTDLSAIRRAEDTLRQAQKMDAVGQLTGGIAHDFNNLLMAISSSLAMLAKRVSPDPQVRRLIDNAQQGARRGAALTQRMLAFARRQDLRPEAVDIPALVRGMAELIQRTLGPAWPVRFDFAEDLPRVIADINQVEMALLNLAVNGRDAMPAGGEIRISARTAAAPAGLAPGSYICLAVTDTGEGMDAETLARATEPFFTTKGVGKGTGLGLSMVHGLATQLGGTFVLESTPGAGTTARLWLPAATKEQTLSSKPALAQPAPLPSGRLRILAVDDDVLIRMNVAAMLEDMGHDVIEADSGEAALAQIQQDPGIDLLITDQAMPGMTGTQLIQHVLHQRPDLPIILATGYGELQTGTDGARITKLGKPFTEQDLARAVGAIMAPALRPVQP